MARLCERPGCSRPADVCYGIDAEHLTVWLQALDPDAAPSPGVLCRRHADAMVVPLRWTLDDRREPVPRLFRAPATTPAAQPPERVRRPRPAVVGTQLGLSDEAADGSPARDEAPPAAAHAPVDVPLDEAPQADQTSGIEAPWRPVFDPDDDLGGLLKARTPLLSRAFSGRERRRGE